MASTTSQHLLIFPYPAQGHMLPLLDLTHQLALHGFTITVLVTPQNLPFLNPLLSAHSSIQPLVLPFPPHPKLPAGVENVKDIGNSGNAPIISSLRKIHDPVILWFKSHPSPPVAIISDFFLGNTVSLAHKLGIPRIAFFSSGAFLTCIINNCWPIIESVRSLPVVDFTDLPRSPSFKQEQLPSMVLVYRESDPELMPLKEEMMANISSWGCIFNSFDALEGEYTDYLRKLTGHPRVFAVGPLSLVGIGNGVGRGNTDQDSDTGVLRWLDACPDGSVLYVCFGSQKLLSRSQMEALADGLEKSATRFVWVVKSGTPEQVENGYGVVPDGFEERVAGRGILIRGWAPQVSILSHRAVGGFLSHCGWNSVLESVVAGVMILGWPMEADQYVNVRLLGEYMGVAVTVCEGANALPDSDELGKRIAESLSQDSPEKVKAEKLKHEALKAVRSGGSSWKGLNELVKELIQLPNDCVKLAHST